ncbi:MAG: YdcF family protein [Oscillospiraceae bacterium]|nr:YdcF family protein [Oscillospiraceae bacterium]
MAGLISTFGTPGKACFVLQVILCALLAAGFLLFLLSGVFTNFNIGNLAGCVLCGGGLLLTVFHKRAWEIVRQMQGNAIGRAVLAGIVTFFIVCIVTGIIISVLMIRAADRNIPDCGTIIVLGCRVKENGPSLMLQKRIEAAYKYLAENENAVCIASGGQGADEPMTEAAAIKNALVEMGIDPERIIEEDRSENTFQNIRNSLEIMDGRGLPRRAVIVTSEFHQLRAHILASKQGLEAGAISSATNIFLLPSYWIREWFGVVHEIVIGRK